MKIFRLVILPLTFMLTLLWLTASVHGKELNIIGWVENVTILPDNIAIKAKIDSGAKNSSLHCECSNSFQKNGEEWVSFTLINYKGEKTVINRKVERISTIKRHFGDRQRRYVIKLDVCLGGITREVEVSLISREGFNYQMLIGRTYLQDLFLIDPSKKFLSKQKCDAVKP